MILFYDINPEYARWLRTIDDKVPEIVYNTNNKFFCGAVVEIAGTKFYAPISSNTQVFRTSFPIKDESQENAPIISTIRFCFMIPAMESVLTPKNFDEIRKENANYARLLEKEWSYCRNHENEILSQAEKIYKIGCNPRHKLSSSCCNFRLLQNRYIEWEKN